MPEWIREGKTVQIAIDALIKELQCLPQDLKIEIIQEPVKGIFGIAKLAKIKAKAIHPDIFMGGTAGSANAIDETAELSSAGAEGLNHLKKILDLMGIGKTEIRSHESENTVQFSLHADLEGVLIGHHGQTLSALQYVLNRMYKPGAKPLHFVVDVGGYRDRHQAMLQKMARHAAGRVQETNQEEELAAMSAFDRRIVHLTIKDFPQITSYSIGEGSLRRVVIAPRKTQADHHQDQPTHDQS